jgi:hypothetical protein
MSLSSGGIGELLDESAKPRLCQLIAQLKQYYTLYLHSHYQVSSLWVIITFDIIG